MKDSIAQKVREKRKAVGITQAELSERAGVHRITISNLELGKNTPQFRNLEKVAKGLNVPVVDLLPSSSQYTV